MLEALTTIITTLLVAGLLGLFTVFGLGCLLVFTIRGFIKLFKYAFCLDKKKKEVDE